MKFTKTGSCSFGLQLNLLLGKVVGNGVGRVPTDTAGNSIGLG